METVLEMLALARQRAPGEVSLDLLGWYESVQQWLLGETQVFATSALTRSFLVGAACAHEGDLAMSRAFYYAYQSANRDLLGLDLTDAGRFAFCVTESSGNGPKSIESYLSPDEEGYTVSGEKSFVTAVDLATDLLVAVSAGWEEGVNQIALLRLDVAKLSGDLKIEFLPSLGFLPGISHGRIKMDRLRVKPEMVVSLDAYSGFVRPFRWYEDLHVFMVSLGLVAAIAERAGNQSLLQRLCLLSSVMSNLSVTDQSPEAVRLFDGVEDFFHHMQPEIQELMASCDGGLGRMWARDSRLLSIAKKARLKRSFRAWMRSEVQSSAAS